MRVLFATAEAYPIAKTGGLADVSSALPEALLRCGIEVALRRFSRCPLLEKG